MKIYTERMQHYGAEEYGCLVMKNVFFLNHQQDTKRKVLKPRPKIDPSSPVLSKWLILTACAYLVCNIY